MSTGDERMIRALLCAAHLGNVSLLPANTTAEPWLGLGLNPGWDQNLTGQLTTESEFHTSSTTLNVTPAASTHTGGDDAKRLATQVLYERVVVAICCLGLLGNLLNLVVLTKKSLLYTLGRMEKFVYTGFVSLALSDMLFCASIIPHSFVHPNKFTATLTFSHLYNAYSNGVINTFIMSSTWLTVTMTIGRYYVMCHPFRAREVIGLTSAARAMIIVFFLCVAFNLPRFWISKIAEVNCSNDVQYYYVRHGYVREHEAVYVAYMWLYFTVCILVPLIILTCCNVTLIRALRKSVTARPNIGHNSVTSANHLNNSNRITLTLIIIVLMYIVLVCPAEVIVFVQDMAVSSPRHATSYDLAVAIVNTLQALNYSLNFLLYCAMNSHFRRTMTCLVQCRGRSVTSPSARRRQSQTSQKSTYTMNTHTTFFSRSSSHNSSYHAMTNLSRRADSPNKFRSVIISES